MPLTRACESRSSTVPARQASAFSTVLVLAATVSAKVTSRSVASGRRLKRTSSTCREFLVDLFVDGDLAGVDDAHVEAGLDGVVQKGRVHRLADRLVAAEGERDVAHAAATFSRRGKPF